MLGGEGVPSGGHGCPVPGGRVALAGGSVPVPGEESRLRVGGSHSWGRGVPPRSSSRRVPPDRSVGGDAGGLGAAGTSFTGIRSPIPDPERQR